jgi:hypothetical protein
MNKLCCMAKMAAEARTGATAVVVRTVEMELSLSRLGSSDRSGGAQSLVDGQQPALVDLCDEVVVLCLQAHHVRLQIGDTPVEQTNLLEHARVSASKVP